MSGTGKSTALGGLRRRGYEVVDTDEPGWTEWSDEGGGYVWREDRVAELLARERDVPLFRVRDGLEPGPVLPALRRGRPAQRASRGAAGPDREQDDERLRQDGRAARADPRAPCGGRAAASRHLFARGRRRAAGRRRRHRADPDRAGGRAPRALARIASTAGVARPRFG